MEHYIYMVSPGGISVLLTTFEDAKEAEDFCEEHDWCWVDENGFEWHLEMEAKVVFLRCKCVESFNGLFDLGATYWTHADDFKFGEPTSNMIHIYANDDYDSWFVNIDAMEFRKCFVFG